MNINLINSMMQDEVKKWFEERKQFYASDSIQKAGEDGRIFLRTFSKDAIHKEDKLDLTDFSADGLIPLQQISEQMQPKNVKGKEKRMESGYAAIPANSLSAKPFHPEGRYGIMITMPKEEDLQQFKQYTNRKFRKEHNIDPNLIEEMKGFFTRASYYNPVQDLWSYYDEYENKTLPSKSKPIPTEHSFLEFEKKNLKDFALNYQSIEKNPENLLNVLEAGKDYNPQFKEECKEKIKQIKEYKENEILIKPRASSKVAIVCFKESELKELQQEIHENFFPKASKAFCAYYDHENKTLTKQYGAKIDIQPKKSVDGDESKTQPTQNIEKPNNTIATPKTLRIDVKPAPHPISHSNISTNFENKEKKEPSEAVKKLLNAAKNDLNTSKTNEKPVIKDNKEWHTRIASAKKSSGITPIEI